MYSDFIRKNGSEMKHIWKDHKVETYIPRKFSDEKVDGMILETDVDEMYCTQQLFEVSVPQIAKRIVEVVAAFHGSEFQVVAQIVTCQTHTKVVEKIIKDSLSLTQQVAIALDAKIVPRLDPAAN